MSDGSATTASYSVIADGVEYGPFAADEAIELYRPQIRGLLAGGVDLFILETISDLVELGTAVQAVRQESESASLH